MYTGDADSKALALTVKNSLNGYDVPCSVAGNAVTVYGIHAEVDPRSGEVNDELLVISLNGVTNPNKAVTGSANKFSISHSRFNYPGGPSLLVQYKNNIDFTDTITANTISATC